MKPSLPQLSPTPLQTALGCSLWSLKRIGARFSPFSRAKITGLLLIFLASAAPNAQAQSTDSIFPRIRSLSLEKTRALTRQKSSALALAGAKLLQSQAQEREVSRRFKLDTTGGLDPFSGQLRFYVALDLERLLSLNKAERQSAQFATKQSEIARQSAEAEAIKRASAAWYALANANALVVSTARRKDAANALHLVADARFKAGGGELSSVVAALEATHTSEDAFQAARQGVALACLELAQSCGFLTAEELEADLAAP